jgi:hypothetical protein
LLSSGDGRRPTHEDEDRVGNSDIEESETGRDPESDAE